MIIVEKVGTHACYVDTGRYGYAKYGVPISGAMDQHSAAVANSLVGNPPQCATLELLHPGHTFLFKEETLIGVAGAMTDILINGKKQSSEERTFKLSPDDHVSIGNIHLGCRLYLSVAGGFDIEKRLGSASPMNGIIEPIKKGQHLKIRKSEYPQIISTKIKSIKIDSDAPINCHPGPEWHLLTPQQQNQILTQTYSICRTSNRMGYRLTGDPIKIDSSDIRSSGVLPGTVQLLPSGLPLILLRDCQTTGGYYRILIIEEKSLNQVAQRSSRDTLTFALNA